MTQIKEKKNDTPVVEKKTIQSGIFPNYWNTLNTLKQVQLHPQMAFRFGWDLIEWKM